jgi:hypothetical protein
MHLCCIQKEDDPNNGHCFGMKYNKLTSIILSVL